MGAGNRRGCNATRRQTNVPKQKAFRLLPYASRKAASACPAWLRFRVWGHPRGEADKGAQGSSPPASAPPSTKGMMQNERHGNAKRGSANQHAHYDRIQLSVTVVDCRLLVPATRSRAVGGSMSLLRS